MTLFHWEVLTVFGPTRAVQVTPSGDDMNSFDAPLPTATNMLLPQATEFHVSLLAPFRPVQTVAPMGDPYYGLPSLMNAPLRPTAWVAVIVMSKSSTSAPEPATPTDMSMTKAPVESATRAQVAVPVASAEVVFGGGVAGLYSVCTLEAYRRRGFGTALTAHALLAARAAGCSHAILQASTEGAGIYARAGFEVFGEITEYKPTY